MAQNKFLKRVETTLKWVKIRIPKEVRQELLEDIEIRSTKRKGERSGYHEPNTSIIYIDPTKGAITETLYHEIGHVIYDKLPIKQQKIFENIIDTYGAPTKYSQQFSPQSLKFRKEEYRGQNKILAQKYYHESFADGFLDYMAHKYHNTIFMRDDYNAGKDYYIFFSNLK